MAKLLFMPVSIVTGLLAGLIPINFLAEMTSIGTLVKV